MLQLRRESVMADAATPSQADAARAAEEARRQIAARAAAAAQVLASKPAPAGDKR
jgi:hypothetical protein